MIKISKDNPQSIVAISGLYGEFNSLNITKGQ